MRKKKIIFKLILCGMVIFTLPLFCNAIAKKLQSPRDVLFSAAENAAKLALVTVPEKDAAAVTAETAVFAASEGTAEMTPKPQRRLKITSDDSGMLSKAEIRVMPSSEDEEGFIEEPPSGEKTEDGSNENNENGENTGKVAEITFGEMNGTNYISLKGGGQIRNLTDIENAEIEAILENAGDFKLKADGSPEVLIYHTHATESYLPDDAGGVYDRDYTFRSSDRSINMVSVGNAIKKELEAAGIGVIHDETLYDEESYNGSYDKSREGISAILRENPGIKLVLDVHRDAIVRSGGEVASAVAEIDGKKAAQIMIISNCNGDSLKFPIPNYRENLKAAAALDNELNVLFPGLCRPVMFDYRQYNQDLSPGSLLIEVGSHGNTHAEAIYSGELIGKGIAKLAG